MIQAAEQLRSQVGLTRACAAFGIARSSVYAQRTPTTSAERTPTPPANALQPAEREHIWQTLTEPRFVDHRTAGEGLLPWAAPDLATPAAPR